MHRYNILIIDDDEDDFLIVKSLLEEIAKGPLQFDWASSYVDGEKLLAENRHAVCLMDYRLGVRDGIELLKHSADLGFTGPIILMTGIHHSEIDILALEAGAVDYLVKDNLTAEQLARSIRYALGRREMEIDRIERLRAEAENRSKSEFLAHLSHELRTPLTAILGFTELLMISEQQADNAANINVIHRNGKHLLALLNDILDLSKIEAGKLDIAIQPIPFIPFIADIYSLMNTAAMDKNLTLEIIAETDLPTQIYSDPTRLRQVLLNLVGNAIKFTNQGSVQIAVGLIPAEADKPSKIYFNVKDSGIGISQTDIAAIFEPFVQVKHAQLQSRIGSGLGLTISRKLVEYLGGDIHVTSQENRGSQFYFSIDPGDIDLSRFEALNLDVVGDLTTTNNLQSFSGRILVVDDVRDIRSLIGHYVSRCGLTVEFASNGLEAIQQLTRARELLCDFDLVLMDIHMPVMDGISAATEIRNAGFTCPLIALTAAHMKGDDDLYRKAGFNSSLSKPVDQAQLIYLLEHYLPGRKAVNEKNVSAAAQNNAQGDQKQDPELILVVEDSIDALNATKGLLEVLGWNPITASTVASALEVAGQYQPKIALVDNNLPDGDGYNLSTQLQALIPNIQIYLVSGADFEPTKACQAIKGYLLKPISVQQLHRLLANSKNNNDSSGINQSNISQHFY